MSAPSSRPIPSRHNLQGFSKPDISKLIAARAARATGNVDTNPAADTIQSESINDASDS